MDFDFVIKLRDLAVDMGETLVNLLKTSIGDVFKAWGLSGSTGFLPESFLDITFVEFLLAGGIAFIIAYNLAKWLVPFLN